MGVLCTGFTLNRTEYYYRKNLQGDITHIKDDSGIIVAEYIYDAWGNHEIEYEVNGIGTLNPIRYRGYYYGWEHKGTEECAINNCTITQHPRPLCV